MCMFLCARINGDDDDDDDVHFISLFYTLYDAAFYQLINKYT